MKPDADLVFEAAFNNDWTIADLARVSGLPVTALNRALAGWYWKPLSADKRRKLEALACTKKA